MKFEKLQATLKIAKVVDVTRVTGTHKGRRAERWSDGKVFIWIGTCWIQEIGQERHFVAD